MSTSLHIDRITPGSRQAPIDSIEALVAREHLSRSALGSAGPGDASFPGRLGRGSDVHLGTAGTVAISMNLEPVGPRFLEEADAFSKKTGIEPQGFGERATINPGFVLRLGRGRSPTLGTDDKVGALMANTASAVEPGAGLARGRHDGRWVSTQGREKMDEYTRLMTTREVAAHVGLSHRTLESYRSRGGGPPFYVVGTVLVRYLLSEVLKWATARRRHSTSDDGLTDPVPKDGDEENDGDDEDDDVDGPGKSGR